MQMSFGRKILQDGEANTTHGQFGRQFQAPYARSLHFLLQGVVPVSMMEFTGSS